MPWLVWYCSVRNPGLASFSDSQLLPLIPGITKTQLPVPTLEIIAKFPISPRKPTSNR